MSLRCLSPALFAAVLLLAVAPTEVAAQDDSAPAARNNKPPRHPPADPRADDPAVWPGDALPPGAMLFETRSGLRYAILELGNGERPSTPFDKVQVHYTGWLTNGSEFDSSRGGAPASFALNGVIGGWTEGVRYMPAGSKFKFVIPAELGYGERGSPPNIGPGATLVFDVELLAVTDRVDVPDFERPAREQCQELGFGILHQVVREGEGETVRWNDKVSLHYTAWLEDGTLLETSLSNPQAAMASCSAIPMTGLAMGLEVMQTGGVSRFIVPARLAYGEQGAPPQVPPGMNVIYQIEVFEVEPGPPPLPTPDFVLPAEGELTTTESGLQYQIVSPGDAVQPTAESTVVAHYAGWFPDGLLFDSSWQRGEPTEFPLNRVIAGWTEGLQLIGVGGHVRLVIPGDLAYGERGFQLKIPPNATLVFDIRLEQVK